MENPGWYTSYTPYQAEISQGRLQSLLNYQTLVTDLTGMSLSNASLLDESTAAAEAMSMCYSLKNMKRTKFFVDERCHPQNIDVVKTRGSALGLTIEVGNVSSLTSSVLASKEYCGVLIQYPDTYGGIYDWSSFCNEAHSYDTLVVAATDLLASVLLKPVGEQGFDIAIGSSQRFGIPMGFGGPHAAFLATTELYSRKMPGRIIGMSIDSRGKPALRMAMQTREQHIRRDKATSNICTAQALLANMAAFYCCYHGPEGLKKIAGRIQQMALITFHILESNGIHVSTDVHSTNPSSQVVFDTFTIHTSQAKALHRHAADLGLNIRLIGDNHLGISFGETISEEDILTLLSVFRINLTSSAFKEASEKFQDKQSSSTFNRTTAFLTHPNFNTYHSETQLLRYIKHLENKDLALNTSMISLGSCTMKLNATVEMQPVTWPEVGNIHPFAPLDQVQGYLDLIQDLNKDLAVITSFAACSTQPNSGAQGEYAGLLCIRSYHLSRNESHRNICLIPISAHGTNPASAAMCGMKVIVIKSDDHGNVDIHDLKAKAKQYKDTLGALMITYPSTYGVFEEEVKDIIDTIHTHGGLVYMDGANMNAQVALTSPGFIGADVCHLNLHKTFCIPHGGGGPGVGTIGVAKHLAPFLPGHPIVPVGGEGDSIVIKTNHSIAAAPYGSASILPISWMYIKMLGEKGLKEATSMAILNANYMAKRLSKGYTILFQGKNGNCAHEFIIDLRPFKEYHISEEDVAKRLQDYGFHSPTMSWPVSGTLMIEPTESEDKAELDRFCDALLLIRQEIDDIMKGHLKAEESPLHNAPHTIDVLIDSEWKFKYSRKVACFPAPWINQGNKFWPTVSRLDNVYGDRNLVCTCPPIESYQHISTETKSEVTH